MYGADLVVWLATRAFTVRTFYHAGTVGVRTNTTKYPWSTALLAHMVRACTHTPFTAVHALQRTHEDPQGQAQHARHPQYPHTRHQVQTRTNMDRRRTRTRSVTRRSAQRTQTCGQAARHRVQPLHPARQLPLEVRPHCALSVHHAQKADEISKKDKIFLRALGFNLQHLSRR